MKILTLNTLEQLHIIFRAYRSHDGFGFWFRGQADERWPLLPKAGRKEFYLPDGRDMGRFNGWCRQAVAYFDLPVSKYERLAIAQHYGLATRLLDWSMNPLVACYFACAEASNLDGAVYIFEAPSQFISKTHFDEIIASKGVYGYIPNVITARVNNQKGLFTIHSDATKEIEISKSFLGDGGPNLTKIIFPAIFKTDVVEMLDDYGINRASLFPDLDGLSAHINSGTIQINKNA